MPAERFIQAGTVVGRLTVTVDRHKNERVQCRCSCGAEHTVAIEQWGTTRSCGCLKRDACVERSTKHGLAGTGIYMIWAEMIARCERPTHKRYADYGGRGITVCERWHDVTLFVADMGHRPPGRSLDRIDNDGGYSPENCRWADASTQSKNRRRFGFENRERDELGRWMAA